MALTAVIRALERLSSERAAREAVRVVTSSQYTVDGAAGKAERHANQDLWNELDGLVQGRRILWEWEPDETMYLQERAAELARLAMKRGGS
jgi:ribonuclease HI